MDREVYLIEGRGLRCHLGWSDVLVVVLNNTSHEAASILFLELLSILIP